MKLFLYRLATTLGGPFIRWHLDSRMKRGKEDAQRFHERLGKASFPRPKGRVVWIHAASVGESLSVLPVIERIQRDHANCAVLITTGTVTSAKLMAQRLPLGARHQYAPVDRIAYVRQFLDHWKPDLAIWVESEFWPNMVVETHARGVPMVLLNGRMSDQSFTQWSKSRAIIKRILSAFGIVLAQSDHDQSRFEQLGASNVTVPGNLKFASPPLPCDDDVLNDLKDHIDTRPVWLAASTHRGEDLICAKAHKAIKADVPGLLTIIAPRHPERGDDICTDLKTRGFYISQRSRGETIAPNTDIYVADTLGEMGVFYRLSPVVFMGKSLVGGGGQNPLEPAQLSSALVFGPDMSNFSAIVDGLTAAGGARIVQNGDQLALIIKDLLETPEACTQMARAAKDYVESEAEVLERVMEALTPMLGGDIN